MSENLERMSASRLWWLALFLFCTYVAPRYGGTTGRLSLIDQHAAIGLGCRGS